MLCNPAAIADRLHVFLTATPLSLVASRCSLGAGTHERTLFGGTFVIQQVGEGSQNESWSGILLARGAAQKKKW